MNTPLHQDRWRITLAILSALAFCSFGLPVLDGVAAVVMGEIGVGGGAAR